ncbi:Hypothetical protein NTJ_07712 [Nesidiocoris tenuis]|uniref:Uncharacterized protein n=1 Tax=Nesidiocoris tenuis TaxID=355587 RepID=A0ABN7ARS7_9HEMI|nr:Hypothetical protein NTJ_07712 [Nesidiocoris tenuis]
MASQQSRMLSREKSHACSTVQILASDCLNLQAPPRANYRSHPHFGKTPVSQKNYTMLDISRTLMVPRAQRAFSPL